MNLEPKMLRNAVNRSALASSLNDGTLKDDTALIGIQFPDFQEQGRIGTTKRLTIEEAELLCSKLNEFGISVKPYDFKGTVGLWDEKDFDGTPYKHLAAKEFVMSLADELGVDFKSVQGFSQILREITVKNFRTHPINAWGTTLDGLLQSCGNSPAKVILPLIEADPDFKAIKQISLNGGDFPVASSEYWSTPGKRPKASCRQAIKQLLISLAASQVVNPFTVSGFKKILPSLNSETFRTHPINPWGTTLGTVLKLHNGSPSSAVLSLINTDPEFSSIKEVGLSPVDFPKAPNGTWVTPKGNPTHQARLLVKRYLQSLAHPGRRITTLSGFSSVVGQALREMTKAKLEPWDTTLLGMLDEAYGTPAAAIRDFIQKSPEYLGRRKRFLEILEAQSPGQKLSISA